MKQTGLFRRGACALSFFVVALPSRSIADQTIAGNLTVTGSATVATDASVGGNLDVEGNNLTLGNNSGNYGVGVFYLPSGADGTRWRLTRLSAWLWEVENGGTVMPSMRLDSSNNLTLYSGGTAALTLNPSAQSLTLGSATLTASGTGLTTNGALTVGGAFTAPNYTASSGTITGGSSNGLTLNAGGTNQNVTLTPSGSGNVIINGNLGVGTTTPSAKVHVAGKARIDDLLSVGGSETGESVMVISAGAPAYGVAYTTPSASGWSRGYRFIRGDTGAYLGGFGGQGTNHTLNKLWLGVNYDQSWVDIASTGITVLPSTASTSSGNGALVVVGGAGVSGNLNVGGSTSQLGTATIGGTSPVNSGLLTIKGDFAPNNPIVMQNTNATNSRIVAFGPGVGGGGNSFGFHDYTRGVTMAAFANTDGALTLGATTSSTSTTTGALKVAGGAGIAGAMYARNLNTSYSLGMLPAGLTNGQNTIYVSGSADASGTSDLRPNSIQVAALGANSMSIRTLDLATTAQNTAGNVSMLGVRMLTYLSSTGTGSATAYSASPYIIGTGNMTAWVGYQADNGGFTSTGDVTGAMTAFQNGTFGRASATTVTVFQAQDLVKGSGVAAGFRGQVSAATGKYNLYLDGTAANLLAGQTSIADTTVSTDKDTGALVVEGGVGIEGNLNVGGTFAATNYTASGGTITGSTSAGLTLAAGGSNQNVTVTPSGTGSTVLNGKVGIGTSAPAAKLDVTGGSILVSAPTANSQDLFIANAGGRKVEIVTDAEGDGKLMLRDAGGTTTQVSITAGGSSYLNGGNVGIGSSAPLEKLHVEGAVRADVDNRMGFILRENSGDNFRGGLGLKNNGDAYLELWRDDGTISRLDANGSSYFMGGNLGIGTASPTAKLAVLRTGSDTWNPVAEFSGGAGRLLISNFAVGADQDRVGLLWENQGISNVRMWMGDDSYLYSAATDPTQSKNGRRFIQEDDSGNVGIGTTAPAWTVSGFTTLDVRGTSFGGLVTVSTATLDADWAQLGQFAFVDRNTTSGLPAVARIGGFLSGSSANNRGSLLVFSTKKDGGALTDAMRIDANQNVGIGTTAPTAKLHVNGSTRFEGPVRIAPQGDLEMGEFTTEPNQ
ncbi:MAG: hypothetical protein HYV96_14915 [Opitutae bacterium]|nr:hypothetical protein [Opitutae bacterium]